LIDGVFSGEPSIQHSLALKELGEKELNRAISVGQSINAAMDSPILISDWALQRRQHEIDFNKRSGAFHTAAESGNGSFSITLRGRHYGKRRFGAFANRQRTISMVGSFMINGRMVCARTDPAGLSSQRGEAGNRY